MSKAKLPLTKANFFKTKNPKDALSEELLKKLPYDAPVRVDNIFSNETKQRVIELRKPTKKERISEADFILLERLAADRARAVILDKSGTFDEYVARVKAVLEKNETELSNAKLYVKPEHEKYTSVTILPTTKFEVSRSKVPDEKADPKKDKERMFFYLKDEAWHFGYYNEGKLIEEKLSDGPMLITLNAFYPDGKFNYTVMRNETVSMGSSAWDSEEVETGNQVAEDVHLESITISEPFELKEIDKYLQNKKIDATATSKVERVKETVAESTYQVKQYDDRPFEAQMKACANTLPKTSVSVSEEKITVQKLAEQLIQNLTYNKKKAPSDQDAQLLLNREKPKPSIFKANSNLMAMKTYETNRLRQWIKANEHLPMKEFIEGATRECLQANQNINDVRSYAGNKGRLSGDDGTVFINQMKNCNTLLAAAAAENAFEQAPEEEKSNRFSP